MTYLTTGTTEAVYVPRDDSPGIVRPGEAYFVVKIKGAQAAYHGPFWEGIERLVVTSQVDLHVQNYPNLTEPVHGIGYSSQVKRGRAEKLGLELNLVNLVPARMTHVTVQIDYILDVENKLALLAGLINDQALMSAVSLAPAAAIAARTVSAVAQKLLQALMGTKSQQPILQFRRDFDIATGDLRDGYYVILATRDDRNPIPRPLTEITVDGVEVLYRGEPVTQWSYVILEVRSQKVRTRYLSENAEWEARLGKAEAQAEDAASDSSLDDEQRRLAWQSCRELLKEASTLLAADASYLPKESQEIIAKAYADCYRKIHGRDPGPGRAERGKYRSASSEGEGTGGYEADRRSLGLPEAGRLASVVREYEGRVEEASRLGQLHR